MTRVAASPGVRLSVRGVIVFFAVAVGQAHTGPPFPIVSNQTSGAYTISVWTDPDSTDDGSAGGQFWITVRPASGARSLPVDTRIGVTLTALDRPGQPATVSAEPVASDVPQRFAALVMDHEGRFRVRVTIAGPLGAAEVEADVDATYDTRPPPAMIALYLVPFVLVGFLWVKLLLRRRRGDTREDEGNGVRHEGPKTTETHEGPGAPREARAASDEGRAHSKHRRVQMVL